jgi:hypothetical protein
LTFRLPVSSSLTCSAARNWRTAFSSAERIDPAAGPQRSIEAHHLRARCGGLLAKGLDSTVDAVALLATDARPRRRGGSALLRRCDERVAASARARSVGRLPTNVVSD